MLYTFGRTRNQSSLRYIQSPQVGTTYFSPKPPGLRAKAPKSKESAESLQLCSSLLRRRKFLAALFTPCIVVTLLRQQTFLAASRACNLGACGSCRVVPVTSLFGPGFSIWAGRPGGPGFCASRRHPVSRYVAKIPENTSSARRGATRARGVTLSRP